MHLIPFFVLQDGSPLEATQVRNVLRKLIKLLNLNEKLYDTHLLRIGRSSDLFKQGFSIDTIKKLGCWKSNAVYTYIKTHVL